MRSLLPGLILLLETQAFAGDLVVYSGDSATATATLAETLPVTAERTYDLAALDTWLAGKPTTLTAGKLVQCSGAKTTSAAVAELVKTAQVSVDDLDFASALSPLQTAHNSLVCLSDAADPAAVARLEYLLGVAYHFGGDGGKARESFNAALAADPNYGWDNGFPPSARTEFDKAKESLATAKKVTLAVLPRDAAVRVDGKDVVLTNGKVDLVAGTHLVQVGKLGPTTVQVVLDDSGAASLIVPAQIRAEATAWAADPVLGGDLARVFAVFLPGKPVSVITGPDVYTGGNGALTWTRVTPIEVKHGAPVGAILTGTGGGVFLGGAVLATIGWTSAQSAIRDGEADGVTTAEWQAAGESYDRARPQFEAGKYVAIGGLALAAIGGALLSTESASVGPIWLGDGAGIAVRIGGIR